MNHFDQYTKIFQEIFEVSAEEAKSLKYMEIPAWDSVGHMNLVSELEDTFDIMMDTEDIIDLSSFEKGMEILREKYNVEF